MDIIYSVLSFVVAVGVLVTVHEFGHFWVARRLGVKVLRFSVGFGRALWSRRAGPDAVEYVIAAIPLGGYVKMLDEREAEVDPADLPRSFNRQPVWVRVAVVLAGPGFNFLFAALSYWLVFVIGVSGVRALVGEVEPGSVMARAGLLAGDEVVAVDGAPTRTWETVIQEVLGKSLEQDGFDLRVERAGGARSLRVDLRDLALDDLTRGQFFDALGLEPQRPRIPAVIGRVSAGSPAQAGGLLAGDSVIRADGEPIEDWPGWVDYVRARPEVPIEVEIERAGEPLRVRIVPERIREGGQEFGRIGAAVVPPEGLLARFYVLERLSPWPAAGKALEKTGDMTLLTLKMFWKMLLLEVSVENLSGPISIAQYAGYSAQIGVSRFVEFLAIVSISLGILNLLPIPVLDGGHLLYYLIEFLKGGPLSETAQLAGQRLGIAMLFGLMGLAFYNDISRLLG